MSKRSAQDWLGDMIQWGDRLDAHIRGVEWNAFLANAMLQDAASKCLEAIGEAAGKLDDLDPNLSAKFFGTRLKLARRSRDRLSHGYYQIDLAIVWQTARESIPELVAAARSAAEFLKKN